MENRKIIFSVIKWISFPIFLLWIFISDYERVHNEYLLIKNSEVVIGTLFKAESEDVEIEDNNKIGYAEGFNLYYSFKSSNGYEIQGEDFAMLDLPLEKDIKEIPYKVEVEYLKENPKINRIKDLPDNNNTFWELFRRELLFGVILLGGYFFVFFLSVKNKFKKNTNHSVVKMSS